MSKQSIFKEGTLPNAIKQLAIEMPNGYLSRGFLVEALKKGSDESVHKYIPEEIDKMEEDLKIIPVDRVIKQSLSRLDTKESELNGKAKQLFDDLQQEDHYVDANDLSILKILAGKMQFVDLDEMLNRYNKIDEKYNK